MLPGILSWPAAAQEAFERFYARTVRRMKGYLGPLGDGQDTVEDRVQRVADDGDIVVAMVPDEASGEPRATVKRLSRRGGPGGRARFCPQTGLTSPIESDGLVIVGRVTDVWRRYPVRASARRGELPIEEAPPWVRERLSPPAQIAEWSDLVRRYLAGEQVIGVGSWEELVAQWRAEDGDEAG